MSDQELWSILITVLAAPVLLHWLTDGIQSRLTARRARKEQLAADEREASAEEDRDLRRRAERAEAREDQLDDYAHILRDQLREAGIRPAPWPKPDKG